MTDARIVHVDLQLSRQLIQVDGEVDVTNVTEFKLEAERALERRPALILVDLRSCGFIDSSGVAALVELQRRFAAAGSMLGIVARREPRLVLRITAVDEAIPVFESMAEALHTLDGAHEDRAAPTLTSP